MNLQGVQKRIDWKSLSFLSFVLISQSLFGQAHAISLSQGTSAPDFSLTTVDGEIISLAHYRDKIVVLIYWRTNQQRSLLALKDGQEVLDRYENKGVKVLSVTTDTAHPDNIKTIMIDNHIRLPVLLDPDRQVYGSYGIWVYPTTIVIDRAGKFVYGLPGHALTYRNALEGHLRYILGEITEEEMEEKVYPHEKHIDEAILKAHRRYNLALWFTSSGLLVEAMEAAKTSIDAAPDYADPHMLIGYLYLERGEADHALNAFREALRLNPLSNDAKTGLGTILILKGEPERAIELLTEAATNNPYPQMTYYELGRAYELKGEPDAAAEMYKKAIKKVFENKVLPSSPIKCR
jgi:tetratricopeptide (TPR) repeat protein